jgi:FKBP-type peptidyl-prolyl cis-trans isomerase
MMGAQTPPADVPHIPPPADVAQPPADAVITHGPKPSPTLASRVLSPGAGRSHPGPLDTVTVTYTAWTADGTTIDASSIRDTPSRWTIDRLMQGLQLGIQLMVAGEKRRLWIPPEMANDWAKGVLVFDVELLDIEPMPDAPTTAELMAPPVDAPRTWSGVWYKVLRPGTGTERPKPMSTVTIHYKGWAGRSVFDDSIVRGEPLTVAVDTLMPGLSEALQRMAVGEKSRYWIPAELAYAPPGPPRSALVVNVELLAIQRAEEGQPGTIEVRTNSPDASYVLVRPDGTAVPSKGPRTFSREAPGRYRIKPDKMRSYALGLIAVPGDMVLAPAGELIITITYRPIVQ